MAQVGRPRALDEVKRREVCRTLMAAGCGLEWASRYVGCSARTVRREALRNEDFHEPLREPRTGGCSAENPASEKGTGTFLLRGLRKNEPVPGGVFNRALAASSIR